VPLKVIQVWVTEAKALKLVFKVTLNKSNQQALSQILKEQNHALVEVFLEDFCNLSNLHLNIHLPDDAKNFATLVNTSVGIKEMVHHIFKGMILGNDPHFPGGNWITQVPAKKCLNKLLSGWYAIKTPSLEEENNVDIEGTSHAILRDPHFVNIKSHKKWNTSQIDAAGFSKRFDIDNPLYRDFSAAYSDYMEMTAAVINKGLEFYDHISYDVLDNEEVEANVHLHVGDVVDIKEEEEENSFAIIRAIVFHKANNVNMYIFLVIDWFQVISGKDKLLNCLYYMLQKPEEMHW
ncbi:1777_t:CDS:2, partial [Paraglomus brasilianum]